MISASWIVVLEAEGYGRLVLNGQGDDNLPDGWAETKVSIKRSPTYYGLNRMVSTSLKFVTNGKDYISRIYENEGTEFNINIAFYEYNEPPTDQFLLFFAGLIDMSTFSIEELEVTVDINESNTARKFMSRDDIKVNLNSSESIEGVILPTNQLVNVTLLQRKILLTGDYILGENVTSQSSILTASGNGLAFAIDKISGNIKALNDKIIGNLNDPSSYLWTGDPVQSNVNVKGNIKGRFTTPSQQFKSDRFFSYRVYPDNDPLNPTDKNFYELFDSFYAPDFPFDVDFDFTVKLPANSSMAIVARSTLSTPFNVAYDNIDIQITQNQLFEPTSSPGYLMHEVGERITEVILDKQNSFQSNFFGRTELGYPADGTAAFQTVHSGKQIRNIPSEYPSINFKDWFTSVNAMYNLGAGIEYDQFNNPFIRVEKKGHFFSGQVIQTIHSVAKIKKSVAREWIYNEIVVGYDKAEYEEVQGLEEFNNKFSWANSIQTIKNKLDLVSKLRGDGTGIEYARQLQYNLNPTEDSKYDNDNFTVIVKKDGANYKNVQNENYITENIFSPETAYNLDITPGRMLRNNGSVIRVGLEHYLTNPIKFQFAEQKQNLKSQKIGKPEIKENEDIDVSTLTPGLWIPEIYSFESELTREQLASITRNSNGIIKFSTTTRENTTKYYYGWILDFNTVQESNNLECQLLRVNTSSPDLILIDKDGTTPEQPPIEIDPLIFGVFEGRFPFVFNG